MTRLRLTVAAAPALALGLLVSQAVGSAELRQHVEALFSIGQNKDIDITVPREGFVGAPASPSPLPNVDIPTKEADFETRRLRMTVVDLYETNSAVRIVLQLDEPNPPPGYSNDGLLFHAYAYVEATADGATVHGSDRLVSKEVDLTKTAPFTGGYYGLPFPLLLTSIPALSSDPSMRECGGLVGGGLAVSSEISRNGGSASTQITLRATLLSTVPPYPGAFDLPGVRVKYFDPETKTTSDTPDVNRVKASLLSQEIQRWGEKPDWLWQEMERFDKDGHLMMRCKVVNPK